MHNFDNVVAFDNADYAFTFKPAIDHADFQTGLLFAMPLYTVFYTGSIHTELPSGRNHANYF